LPRPHDIALRPRGDVVARTLLLALAPAYRERSGRVGAGALEPRRPSGVVRPHGGHVCPPAGRTGYP